jgi:inorganic phosphate transporter, PiT family
MSASGKTSKASTIVFLLILLGSLAYTGIGIYHDLQGVPSSLLFINSICMINSSIADCTGI